MILTTSIVTAAVLRPPRPKVALSSPIENCHRAQQLVGSGPVEVQTTPHPLENAIIEVPGPDWSTTDTKKLGLDEATQGHGGAQGQADWRAALEHHGFRQGRKRTWLTYLSESTSSAFMTGAQPPSETGTLFAEVLEFETAAGASGLQEWALGYTCDAADEVFAVPGVPGAVGARYSFPEYGQIIENVSFVIGNRRFAVVYCSSTSLPDRRALIEAVRAVIAHAGRT